MFYELCIYYGKNALLISPKHILGVYADSFELEVLMPPLPLHCLNVSTN